MLTVTIEPMGEVVTLHCAGRIVRGEEFAILCPALKQRTRQLVLDLAGVDAIDAAGVGVLVSLQAAGIYLKLVNPTRQVREVLRVTKLETVFEICESQPTGEGVGPGYVGQVLPHSRPGERATFPVNFDSVS
jgi:anti-anti-sigma factor